MPAGMAGNPKSQKSRLDILRLVSVVACAR